MEIIIFIIILCFLLKNKKNNKKEEAPQIKWQEHLTPQEIRTKIEATKQRIREEMYEKNGEYAVAKKRVEEVRRESSNTTILERAKANAEENKVDVTLETMETEHNHSERVSAATHHHPEDVIPENMLGTIEDLMIKGYDGNLCFERDFVSEGLDMISHFVVPSDVPDFS